MGLTDAEHLWQVKHRRLLYQYYRACLRADQTTLTAVRRLAESDPNLARAIEGIEQALARRRNDPLERHIPGVMDEPRGVPETCSTRSEQLDASPAANDSARPFTVPQDQPPGASDDAPAAPDAPAVTNPTTYEQRPSQQIFAERTDADYSVMVDRKLSASFDRLERGRGDHAARSNVLDFADSILKERMAPSQRLQALHLCATLARASSEYARALDFVDDAVEISLRTGLPAIQIDLLHMRGRIHRNMSHVRHAVEDFRVALALYRNLPDEVRDSLSTTSTVEVANLIELANMEFILALYPAAERHAAEVATKLVALPGASPLAAGLECLRALLHRWRGQPELALRPAAHALELLRKTGDASAISRLHVVTASITLDMAERLPEGTDRTAYIKLAASHFDNALQLARASNDRAAFALAQIDTVRCDRMFGAHGRYSPILEDVYRLGRRWDDGALQAQALTALAQEWAARGETEWALNCYRQALDLTDKSDLPALGVWARRALLQASEMRGIP